jgi:cell division inhibitor SepF
MPVPSDSVVGQVAEAARRRRPLFRVTVSPRLARFLVAAGAQPAATDVVAAGLLRAIPAASTDRWREVAVAQRPPEAPLGGMRKMAVYLGLVEDLHHSGDEYYDEDEDYDEDGQGPALPDGPGGGQAGDRKVAGQVQATDLAGITTLRPRSYNEVREIGRAFRGGTPVLIDLTQMEESDARRIVDFSAGMIFGSRGSLERVSSNVFLLTPANVGPHNAGLHR